MFYICYMRARFTCFNYPLEGPICYIWLELHLFKYLSEGPEPGCCRDGYYFDMQEKRCMVDLDGTCRSKCPLKQGKPFHTSSIVCQYSLVPDKRLKIYLSLNLYVLMC